MRSLYESFRLKVITIEQIKDVDTMRANELVNSLWTYEMTLPNSQRPREYAFKASKNEEKWPKNFEKVGFEELSLISKWIKEVMKFYKKTDSKQDLGIGKRIEKTFKEKDKGFFKIKRLDVLLVKD